MNDLERAIRDTLLRHQDDAPSFEVAGARRAAGLARRRQVRNIVVGSIAGAAALIAAFAAFGGLVRADGSPTFVEEPPSPSPTVATPGPEDMATPEPIDGKVHGWPSTTRNAAGVYSWDADQRGCCSTEGFIHNAYSPGSGDLMILFDGDPGVLVPHRGETAVTVAGREGSYRQESSRSVCRDYSMWSSCTFEEWMVDIQGTTVTIRLVAKGTAPEDEIAEAHEVIESIRMEPRDNELGFRLVFTLTTNTWDSG